MRPPSKSACLDAAVKVRFEKTVKVAGLGAVSIWGGVLLEAENVGDEVEVVLTAVVVGAASEGGTKVFVVVGAVAVAVGVKEDSCARKKKRRKGPISSLVWVKTRLML